MIIGIDGNEANVEKKVGISEYAFELLMQFSSSKFNPPAGGQSSKLIIYLKNEPLDQLPKESEQWNYRIVRPSKLWTQIGLPFDLYFHRPRPDVFFSPTHYSPRFSPIPTVVSVMDLSFLFFSELFRKTDLHQLKNWTEYSVKKAAKVLTISKASKDDIIKKYGIAEHKIVVTYPGVKEVLGSKYKVLGMDDIKKKYDLKNDYILFVGTLQPRKNILRLVEAFKIVLKHSKKDIDLVIVGKKGWKYEDILEAPSKYGVADRVKFLDFVSDEELEVLYRNAVCFVLPSLYEGFGLPVVEAMKYGCPVITSNVSSLPEAGGDAALYVNPEDVDDIALKIENILKDANLRKELIEKGFKHIKKFSWQKTAEETLKVLEEVASK